MDAHRQLQSMRTELADVKQDLKRILKHLGTETRDHVTETSSRWWEGGKNIEQHVEEAVYRVLDDVREHGTDAARRAKHEVEEHPFLTALAIAGVGLMIFSVFRAKRYYF